MKKIKMTVLAVGLIAVLVALFYGGWNLERWVNWKLGYESEVNEQLIPLMQRIDELENKIANEKSWFVLVDTFLVDSLYDDIYPSYVDSMVWMKLDK